MFFQALHSRSYSVDGEVCIDFAKKSDEITQFLDKVSLNSLVSILQYYRKFVDSGKILTSNHQFNHYVSTADIIQHEMR